MNQRQPTLIERLTPHRRKRVGTCLRDDALADDVLTLLSCTGTYTVAEWCAVLQRLENDNTLIGVVIDSQELLA